MPRCTLFPSFLRFPPSGLLCAALVVCTLLANSPTAEGQTFRGPGAARGRDRQAGDRDDPLPPMAGLLVGDNAPPLIVDTWVKGEGFATFERGKVYVIEFWATWCGPCVASFPHMTEIQTQFQGSGVVVVGVTMSDPKNSLESVRSMVAEKGDAMGYRVAWDGQRRALETYLKAARQNYIPCVFVVDREGRVAFIGHPSKLDTPLKQIVDGTFDMEASVAQYKKEMSERMTEEEKTRERRRIAERFARACEAGDWNGAIAAYDEGAARSPAFARDAAAGYGSVDDGKFQILLLRLKDYEKASQFGNDVVDRLAWDHPLILNRIAWTIVDPENKVEKKDLKLALKAAERADELFKHRDGAIIDTLARVYFCMGDLPKAIDLQTKAVEVAAPELQAELSATLEEYRNAAKK